MSSSKESTPLNSSSSEDEMEEPEPEEDEEDEEAAAAGSLEEDEEEEEELPDSEGWPFLKGLMVGSLTMVGSPAGTKFNLSTLGISTGVSPVTGTEGSSATTRGFSAAGGTAPRPSESLGRSRSTTVGGNKGLESSELTGTSTI